MSGAVFDLFGDPVPENFGRRGRPAHVPRQEYRNKVKLLLALGWSNSRIAAALGVTEPTLRKHYFSELKFRSEQRDRMDAAFAAKVWDQVREGNAGAMRIWMAFVERNDRMDAERTMGAQPESAPSERVGKKVVDQQRAIDADADLTAELEQEAASNSGDALH